MPSAETPENFNSVAADHEDVAEKPLGAGIDLSNPSSRLVPYYMRLGDLLGVILLTCIVTYYGLTIPVWHTDIWGHTRFGEWILDHRALPDHEPFCPFSNKDEKPVHSQWLTQVVYASLFRLGRSGVDPSDIERPFMRGAEFLRIFHLFVLGSAYTFLWLAYRRIGSSAGWANAALILSFVALQAYFFVQRPQSLGMCCFAILLFVVSRKETSRASQFALPALFVVWASLHGSFLLGLVLVVLVLLERLFREKRSPNWNWREALWASSVRRLAIALSISVAAVAILNPHGPMLYYYILTFANRPNIITLSEWGPLDFGSTEDLRGFALSRSLILVLWALGGFAGTSRLLLMLPFALWPVLQIRGMVWWSMLYPWLVASYGPGIIRAFPALNRVPMSIPSFRNTLLAALIVFVALLWSPPAQWVLKGRLWPLSEPVTYGTPWRLGMELQASPESRGRWLRGDAEHPGILEALREYPGQQFQGTIYTSESMGDFLLRFAPEGSPIMRYTHAQYFPPDHWRNCQGVKFAAQNWQSFLTRNHANMIVFEPDFNLLAEALRHDSDWWILVDEGHVANRIRFNRQFIAIRKKPV